MTAEAFAAAKVNLALHVTGRRGDGYHVLDSLVAFADVGDAVSVSRAGDWSLDISGPMAAGVPQDDANLCLRAARLCGGSPAAIRLEKRLPVASGIGGGSADAAAVLRALHALDGRALPDGVERLGADVPVCLHGRATRMRGIGERLDDVAPLPDLHACLVNPAVAISTADVFGTLSGTDNASMPDVPEWRSAAECAAWLAHRRNDLEAVAVAMAPAIGEALARIGAMPGCLLSRMSGSGATCFGLFADPQAAGSAAQALAARRPEWWIVPTRLG